MSTAEDFSVRPFVAGTVVGLRSFRAAPSFCLLAMTRTYTWQQGENQAECDPDLWAMLRPQRPQVANYHRVAGVDCVCGFYAYFSDRDDYARSKFTPTVTGIIEGYGTVTIGDLGFRAEKARIVALVQPPPFVQTNYPDVPVYADVAEALAAHPTTKPEDVGITPRPRAQCECAFCQFGLTGAAMAATQFQASMQSLASTMNTTADQMKRLKLWVAEPAAEPSDAVERKREAAQAAAEQRKQAGLGNLGGINRRKRRL